MCIEANFYLVNVLYVKIFKLKVNTSCQHTFGKHLKTILTFLLKKETENCVPWLSNERCN